MSQPENTRLNLTRTADYRETYANSVQIRLSIWDFLLVFGTLDQPSAEQVDISNFQGIFLSPQQAKALSNVLAHNIAQYEKTFGEISLDGAQAAPQRFIVPGGPVH